MIGDTVVGTVECADGARFRVEVNGSLAHDDYYCVVWIMDATKGSVAYAYHAHVDGTATTITGGELRTKQAQIEIADFIQLVARRHNFRQWQPALL